MYPTESCSQAVLDRKYITGILRDKKEFFQNAFGVKNIGLFGSWVRDEARKNSDIDILVQFNTSYEDQYMDLKFFLESLFHREVDLVLKTALKSIYKQTILKEVWYP